jgi:hypothetical protein
VHSENTQDVVPPTERGQDLERGAHELASGMARPLTDEERKAADRDISVGERVYAPASERVPREPAPGHRDFVEHMDPTTPERSSAAGATADTTEPTFTRVERPSARSDTESPMSGSQPSRWISTAPASLVPIGLGWLALGMSAAVGIWLWMRWRRERNRPINRIRRQAVAARKQAYQLRERMPDFELPDEAARPAVGLGTVLLPLTILIWQQLRSRSRMEEVRARGRKASRRGRHTAEALTDADWQQRLLELRERWSPARLDLDRLTKR